MIKINLLRQLQPKVVLVMEDQAPAKKQKVLILVLTLLLCGGGAYFYLQYKSQFQEKAKEDQAAKALAEANIPKAPVEHVIPKQVTSEAVEEIVHELPQENSQTPKSKSYHDLVPSEKIEYQNFACIQILKQIRTATPLSVGFADFIFSSPGEFYVHGLTYDLPHYELLKTALGAIDGSTLKAGLLQPRGKEQEFSFFGSVKYSLENGSKQDRIVNKDKVQSELAQLKTVASHLGIQMKNPQLESTTELGDIKKMIFKAEAACNFDQFQRLVEQLQENKSNLGLIKFALKATGDESLKANVDFSVYVN